jgi:signal transduction histidine kinase
MINGEEKERSRLAKDLHDGVGGLLSATKMHLSILRNEQSISPNIDRFDNTISILDSATQEIRTIAHNLAPEILNNYGLDTALELFCESISNQNLQINYQSVGIIPRLKSNAELIVYRIAQELVNNIIKHAEATEAYVQLSHHNNFMTLSVEDNGKGMNESDKKGIGIVNLKARAETLNGDFTITSAPNEGTTFYIEFDTRMLQAIDRNQRHEAMAS